MARQKHRSQLDSIDEINMTPLIDLTFLLLIIFMITTPLLEYGLDVSPPESTNTISISEDDNNKIVTLNEVGKIVFNKRTLNNEELILELQAMQKIDPKVNVLLRADGDRPYKEVIKVMDAIKSAGIKNISLITQAETNGS